MTSGDIGTVDLLTRAAEAAGDIANTLARHRERTGRRSPVIGSQPDHWRAVEATLRAVINLHEPKRYQAGSATHGGGPQYALTCICCKEMPFPCRALGALRPLAEQVLRNLGDGNVS